MLWELRGADWIETDQNATAVANILERIPNYFRLVATPGERESLVLGAGGGETAAASGADGFWGVAAGWFWAEGCCFRYASSDRFFFAKESKCMSRSVMASSCCSLDPT